MTLPPLADAQKVAALRELLPATGAGIYLDTATAGPLPAETAAAMREANEWELRVGRAVAGREDDVEQRQAEAQAVLAALIGTDPAQLQLAAGLESALEAAVWSIAWRAGDRLAVAPDNQPEVVRAVERFAGRLGLELALAETVADLPGLGARLAVVPHVGHATGRLSQPAELGRELRARQGSLLLDLSLSAGALPISVTELGADAAVMAADRWLLGPELTAACWLPSAEGRSPGPSSALPRTTLLGLARSVGWLEMYVGLEWAFERTQSLARRLAEDLQATEGVELLTPLAELAAIVSFRLPSSWSAERAADELGRRAFAILRPVGNGGHLRSSVAWYNTEDELDRFVAAVSELARHTPDNLPAKPALTVL